MAELASYFTYPCQPSQGEQTYLSPSQGEIERGSSLAEGWRTYHTQL